MHKLILLLLLSLNVFSQGTTNPGGEWDYEKNPKGLLGKVKRKIDISSKCLKLKIKTKKIEKAFLESSSSENSKSMSFFEFIDYLDLSSDIKGLESLGVHKALQQKCNCSESKDMLSSILEAYQSASRVSGVRCMEKREAYIPKIEKILEGL